MLCAQPSTHCEEEVVVLRSDAPRVPGIFEPILCCLCPFLRYSRQEMRVRVPGPIHTLNWCGNDFAICQQLRDGRQEYRTISPWSAVEHFLKCLHCEIFELRTAICNQDLAHRARNIDSRGSVAIATLDKHLFDL